jgi:hypothetical protein
MENVITDSDRRVPSALATKQRTARNVGLNRLRPARGGKT